METPDFRYNQYPGGEYEQTVDGLTREALDGLRAYLREKQTIVEGEEGENRLIIQTWNSGLLEVNSLTADQLQYLLTGESSTDEPVATPEQNREETMQMFHEMLARYPASSFAALCPRPAPEPVPEPAYGFFRRGKRASAAPTTVWPHTAERQFTAGAIVYAVTVTYEGDSDTILEKASIGYAGASIELRFGPHGIAQRIDIKDFVGWRNSMPDYNGLVALRMATSGSTDIAGTQAVTDSQHSGTRIGNVCVRLGYEPEFTFWPPRYTGGTYPRYARYDAATNQFAVATNGKVRHSFTAESGVKMLDEILSTLPPQLQMQHLPALPTYNANDLR